MSVSGCSREVTIRVPPGLVSRLMGCKPYHAQDSTPLHSVSSTPKPPPLQLLQNDPFDLFDMRTHRFLGGRCVSTADRAQDTNVACKRLLQAAPDLQRPLAAFPQKIHEDIQNFQHDTVLRGA